MLALQKKPMTPEILRAEKIDKYFPFSQGAGKKRAHMQAVREVDLKVRTGETLGLVGESGCGKSTLGKILVGLETASGGRLYYKGDSIGGVSPRKNFPRQKIQMIFQDPFSSLNPRQKIKNIIAEGLRIKQKKEKTKVGIGQELERVMNKTGLLPEHGQRYPHEFSGGQRQRVAIARALAVAPEVLVCDEPVSALDVSIQAQIINLLHKMQKEMGLGMLFISHDLSIISQISHSVAVMYMGEILESGPWEKIYNFPAHPYTKALLSAVPVADPRINRRRILLKGEPPSPMDPPKGCLFHSRCPRCMPKCKEKRPQWSEIHPGQYIRCLLYSQGSFQPQNNTP